MDRPSECKWCGCGVRANGKIIAFRCFTSVVDDCWSQSPECKLGVVEDRIQRAIDTLKAAARFELVRDEHGCFMKGSDSCGNWFDAIEIEKVIEILEGEADEQTN